MKRATRTPASSICTKFYFNPRPREEGDRLEGFGSRPSGHFNPRPREEGDAVAHTGTVSDVDFNPRPREEGDLVSLSIL